VTYKYSFKVSFIFSSSIVSAELCALRPEGRAPKQEFSEAERV